MKIHDAYLPSTAASQLKQAEPTAAPASARAEAERKQTQVASDSVGLSELSVRLLGLARVEAPERAARIERLAMEVRSGRYHVDPLAVARRIVDEALGG